MQNFASPCLDFGDRVKKWITINEPWSYSTLGYAQGIFLPNRCSKGANKGLNRQFTFRPGRFASFADNVECPNGGNSGTEPYNVSHNLLLSHAAAVKVYREKYMAPLTFGRYPITMIKRVGDRLPKFTKEQKAMVKGSADFIGLNYYTASYVAHTACIEDDTYMNDPCAFVSNEGWPQTDLLLPGIDLGSSQSTPELEPGMVSHQATACGYLLLI
ncbi:hypothetical protein LguiB_023919 [Lonicera macranthoides]